MDLLSSSVESPFLNEGPANRVVCVLDIATSVDGFVTFEVESL